MRQIFRGQYRSGAWGSWDRRLSFRRFRLGRLVCRRFPYKREELQIYVIYSLKKKWRHAGNVMNAMLGPTFPRIIVVMPDIGAAVFR